MRSLNFKPQDVLVWLHELLDVRRLLVLYGLAVDLRGNNHQLYFGSTFLHHKIKLELLTLMIRSPGSSICVAGPTAATSVTVHTVDQSNLNPRSDSVCI